jgi:hypothetical protein
LKYAFGFITTNKNVETDMTNMFYWCHNLKVIDGLHINAAQKMDGLISRYDNPLERIVIYASEKKANNFYRRYRQIKKKIEIIIEDD